MIREKVTFSNGVHQYSKLLFDFEPHLSWNFIFCSIILFWYSSVLALLYYSIGDLSFWKALCANNIWKLLMWLYIFEIDSTGLQCTKFNCTTNAYSCIQNEFVKNPVSWFKIFANMSAVIYYISDIHQKLRKR